jgi:hypothetical protein
MPSILTMKAASASELVARLRRSNDSWWGDGLSSPWVFRGIGDADNWPLLPSAWRARPNKLEPLMCFVAAANLAVPSEAGNDPVHRSFLEWQSAEKQAIYEFAHLANSIGFKVQSDALAKHQSPLHHGFAMSMRGEGTYPDIPTMALAQHHGIPTRLLDWTESPLVAAYFAAATEFRPSSAKNVCVWAFNTALTRHEDGLERMYGPFRVFVRDPPRGENQYLHSQGGVLTELLGCQDYFLKHHSWPSLETVFREHDMEQPILIAHVLPIEEVPALLTILDREGINTAQLMPSLDNVAKTVVARWSPR